MPMPKRINVSDDQHALSCVLPLLPSYKVTFSQPVEYLFRSRIGGVRGHSQAPRQSQQYRKGG